jgi:[ribosomal protein S5]-alanine N-acetyltransferase
MSGSVRVRPIRVEDAGPLAALYRDNRSYLEPFEPTRRDEYFTAAGQATRLAGMLAEQEQGRTQPYAIEVDDDLAGRITVSNLARGPFCSGSLGYWVAAAHAGRGVATSAVRSVVEECFARHGLHRLEAATLLGNLASQAVLRRNGFTLIGHAPRYLEIAGRWRDHLLFQRLADDPPHVSG